MDALRIALAQINPTVGDLTDNSRLVVEWSTRAAAAGARLVVFPEMALTGYPVEDLVLRPSFAAASVDALHRLAVDLDRAGCGDMAVVVGYLDRDASGSRNSAATLFRGEVMGRYDKHSLPTYRVFDEARYFAPGTRLAIVTVDGFRVGTTICEDVWQPGGPVTAYAAAGVDLLLCPTASPFEIAKDSIRKSVLATRTREAGVPIAYANLIGGQDELVFDGGSMVVAPDGSILASAPQFVEDLLVVDIARPAHPARRKRDPQLGRWRIERVELPEVIVPQFAATPAPVPPVMSVPEQVWGALVTALRDYVHKNGFRTVVLGLSGGIDSAVVAAVAVDALGADSVYAVSMPSQYSSDHSRSDAADLARRTGLHFTEQPIAEMVAAFVGQLELTGLAEENIQARCRGMTLMALSNSDGHLVLATGNKSELAVGYSTIYGDAVGGYAPIKDVPKSMVWDLARWRNAAAQGRDETPPIPESSIAKEPSAELRPGQLDTDSLPDYELLDALLFRYVDCDQGLEEIVAAGYEPDMVRDIIRKVDLSEYKRRQYPIGTKVTSRAFGRDRRMPITNRWRE
ncbi:NAD+ synthase (glutamine-hydrolysing) [Rhodococcoides trifolii]|uniref:Glutamine-dependent NAD(+) synthetase n=1 Tax=Rhodococcoides trifolii TaxID=908250 RepID=A0A917CZX7_9NOCA|nr:NAD+ synthase [Rhodococcus trifolii]GGG04912.1 NAD+ synthase (glutamine-hydrolysing) [Rhodococcus trifolii]